MIFHQSMKGISKIHIRNQKIILRTPCDEFKVVKKQESTFLYLIFRFLDDFVRLLRGATLNFFSHKFRGGSNVVTGWYELFRNVTLDILLTPEGSTVECGWGVSGREIFQMRIRRK